ncbi:MAG TPA: TIR domain-containing protein [Phototrophicaceae bacterium]|jgi:tetratricopeptide (TPR) repeat protein|nr:TIR domain-containing protein [Phototrophicaceae bacterium]
MSNQIFVSYAHSNAPFVKILKEKLEEDSFNVWIDTQLKKGSDWRKTIDEAIKTSFVIIVVITPEASSSKYVTYEWSYGLGLDLPVIPIQLAKPPEVHPRLELLQYFDFTDRFNEPWEELVELLKEKQRSYLSRGATEVVIRLLQHAREEHQRNDLRNAQDSLKEALKFAAPSLADDIHYEMALIHMKLRDFDQAEQHLKDVLQYNGQHIRGLVTLGALYRTLADRESTDEMKRQRLLTDAENKFLTALELQNDILDENGESVWGSLGGVLKRLGYIEKAIEAYQKAVRVKKSSYPYNNLGILYMEKDELIKVRENFGLVELFAQAKLNFDPGDEWSHNDLFVAQLILNKIKAARDALTKVKLVAPPYALESLLRTLDQLSKIGGIEDEIRDYIIEAKASIEQKLKEYA